MVLTTFDLVCLYPVRSYALLESVVSTSFENLRCIISDEDPGQIREASEIVLCSPCERDQQFDQLHLHQFGIE